MRYIIRYMPEQSRLSSRFYQIIQTRGNQQNGKSLEELGSAFHPLVFGQK